MHGRLHLLMPECCRLRCRTALHCAAAAGHSEAARTLVQAGACLELRDSQGRTPLAAAAAAGQEAAVRMLLLLGASAAVVDSSGATPMHLAAQAASQQQAGGPVGVGIVAALLQAGAPIDAVNDRQQTALHLLAARPSGAAAIEALLAAGANAYLADAGGATPLGCALAAGNQAAVELLLLAGEPGVGGAECQEAVGVC